MFFGKHVVYSCVSAGRGGVDGCGLLSFWLVDGCGYVSSLMGCIPGEMGGEVELMLLGRLMRPPNEPSTFLNRNMHVEVKMCCLVKRREGRRFLPSSNEAPQ